MHPQLVSEIEKIIGYTFKDKKLLESAFTHSSYARDCKTESNERLEFLGDGILNFIVAEFLYTHRNVDEGIMSQKRSKIVSREPLSDEVERLGLIKYLRANRVEESAKLSAKFKSNVYEAVLAGIYLDGGLDKAKDFVVRTLIKNIKIGQNEDYKSKLQIKIQEVGLKVMYKDKTITEVPPWFASTVYIDGVESGRGEGGSKKLAQQKSAKMALQIRFNEDESVNINSKNS